MASTRALLWQVGGFDTRYAPAYYEDADLAFAVRASGHTVRMQPAAVVVHDEGTTAGILELRIVALSAREPQRDRDAPRGRGAPGHDYGGNTSTVAV